MPTFRCYACQEIIEASPATAGKDMACPGCRTVFRIPVTKPQNDEAFDEPERPDPYRLHEEDRPVRPRRRDDDYDDRPRSRRRDRDRDDDDDYDDDRPRRSRSRSRWECPYCGSDEPPRRKSEMNSGGIVFVVLGALFCWPMALLGLLFQEEYRVCRDCRREVRW